MTAALRNDAVEESARLFRPNDHVVRVRVDLRSDHRDAGGINGKFRREFATAGSTRRTTVNLGPSLRGPLRPQLPTPNGPSTLSGKVDATRPACS